MTCMRGAYGQDTVNINCQVSYDIIAKGLWSGKGLNLLSSI